MRRAAAGHRPHLHPPAGRQAPGCRVQDRLQGRRNWVRAWYLWTWAREQEWMDNPAGYLVNRLRERDELPEEFLELAQLTPDEIATLKRAWASSEQYLGWPSLDELDKLQSLAPRWAAIYEAMRGHRA